MLVYWVNVYIDFNLILYTVDQYSLINIKRILIKHSKSKKKTFYAYISWPFSHISPLVILLFSLKNLTLLHPS